MSRPVVTTLALKRRTLVERRALMLLRGGNFSGQAPSPIRPSRIRTAGEATSAQERCFAELRRFAVRNGFTLLQPTAPYMGADELTLLAWLASAQRVFDPCPAPYRDPALRAAVMRCADLLDGMGLRLSPLTMCSGALQVRNGRHVRTGHSRTGQQATTVGPA